MVKSFYGSGFMEEGYELNRYYTHKYDDDNYLMTTEHGAWVVLDREEYDLLRLKKVHEDESLYKELKKKGIVITEDNVEDVIKEYGKRKNFLLQGPTLHIVTPTMRCNARCVYYHSRAKPEEGKKYDMDEELYGQ